MPQQSAAAVLPADGAVREAARASARPRLEYLDTAKGFAAAFVIILHLFSDQTLLRILGPWHVWQAVPIFLFAAGITGSLSCRKYTGITGNNGWRKNKEDLGRYYSTLPAKALALYIPYAVLTVIYYMWTGEPLGIELFFNTMLMGYLGPGGYFIPLIIQHLVFFPLVLSIRGKVGSDLKFLGIALLLSVLAELPFAFTTADQARFLYRIFYFRYLFVCCLAAVLADGNPFSKGAFRLLALIGALYIGATCYLSNTAATPPYYWNLWILRADDWYFQHYPSAFFTAFFVLALRDYERFIPKLSWIIALGKSSYEIFIFQMFFFITIVISLKRACGWTDLPFTLKVAGFFFCLFGGLAITRLKAKWKAIRQS